MSPGFFEVFHIPVLRGRSFNERDNVGGVPVVIINQTMANRMGSRTRLASIVERSGSTTPWSPNIPANIAKALCVESARNNTWAITTPNIVRVTAGRVRSF